MMPPSTPTIASSIEIDPMPQSDVARFRYAPIDGRLGGVALVAAVIAASVERKRGKPYA